jgi:hypothetical protein
MVQYNHIIYIIYDYLLALDLPLGFCNYNVIIIYMTLCMHCYLYTLHRSSIDIGIMQ